MDTETTDVQSTQVVSHQVAIPTDVLSTLATDAALELTPAGVVGIHTLTIPTLDGVAMAGEIHGVAAAGAIPGEAVAAAGEDAAMTGVTVAVVDTTTTIVTITTNAEKVADTETNTKRYKANIQ